MRLLIYILAASLSFIESPGEAKVFQKEKVEAVLVIRLLSFIQWSKSSKASPRLCVFNAQEHLEMLKQVLQHKSAKDSGLLVYDLQSSPQNCDVVLYSGSASPKAEAKIGSYPNAALIETSDADGWSRKHTLVKLLEKDGYVKFIIYLANARARSILVDSRLLKLAYKIEEN